MCYIIYLIRNILQDGNLSEILEMATPIDVRGNSMRGCPHKITQANRNWESVRLIILRLLLTSYPHNHHLG